MSVSSYAEQGLAPLRELLTSDRVNEVVINPDGAVFVEHADAAHMAPAIWVEMSERAIRDLGSHLAGETGNALGEDHPIVSGRGDGVRRRHAGAGRRAARRGTGGVTLDSQVRLPRTGAGRDRVRRGQADRP